MSTTLQQRSEAFVQLGKICSVLSETTPWPGFGSGLTQDEFQAFQTLIEKEFEYNGWFTPENIRMALKSWGLALTKDNMEKWIAPYFKESTGPDKEKTIAVICAGNIPMVGLHDILSVLLTGNKALIKL